jgi:predicted alpha/beta superfamily hydrolase
VVDELKPFVDRNYQTMTGRSDTFMMGSSMGALVSLYALCEYPEVFGGAGCLSTHWPAVDGILIGYLERTLPKPGTHKMYFDYGTKTLDVSYEGYQRQVDDVMKTIGYVKGKDWITRKFEGAEHSERSWRKRVHIPLTFFFGKHSA